MKKIRNKNKEKLFSKYYILMMVIASFVIISMQMSITTLPVYTQYIGGSKSIVGFTSGIFAISALFFRPLFGNLLDNKGRKITLIIGIIVFSIASLSYNFTHSILILLILRSVHGIGFSAYSNAGVTIIADIVPNSRLEEGLGIFWLVNIIAMAFGPAIGLEFTENSNYNALFILLFMLSVIGLIFSFFINYEHRGGKYKKIKSDYKNKETGISTEIGRRVIKKNVFFEKTAIPISVAQFFISLSFGSVITFLPLYALSQKVQNIGIFFTVYAIAIVFIRIIAGKVSDNYGPSWVVFPGISIFAISLAILAFASSMPVFLISAVLFGFGLGTITPAFNAIMFKTCPIERRGIGNATLYSAKDIGIGLGSILWGFISDKFSFTYIYLGSVISAILSLLIYLLFVKNKLNEVRTNRISNLIR